MIFLIYRSKGVCLRRMRLNFKVILYDVLISYNSYYEVNVEYGVLLFFSADDPGVISALNTP